MPILVDLTKFPPIDLTGAFGEVVDDTKTVTIQVLNPAHGKITGITYPQDKVVPGTTVTVSVEAENDCNGLSTCENGAFKVRYSSTQINGETSVKIIPKSHAERFDFSFTMPNEDVSLTIELIRIT